MSGLKRKRLFFIKKACNFGFWGYDLVFDFALSHGVAASVTGKNVEKRRF